MFSQLLNYTILGSSVVCHCYIRCAMSAVWYQVHQWHPTQWLINCIYKHWAYSDQNIWQEQKNSLALVMFVLWRCGLSKRSESTHWHMTVGLVNFDSNVGRILVLLDTNGVCVTDSATEGERLASRKGYCYLKMLFLHALQNYFTFFIQRMRQFLIYSRVSMEL